MGKGCWLAFCMFVSSHSRDALIIGLPGSTCIARFGWGERGDLLNGMVEREGREGRKRGGTV